MCRYVVTEHGVSEAAGLGANRPPDLDLGPGSDVRVVRSEVSSPQLALRGQRTPGFRRISVIRGPPRLVWGGREGQM